MAVQSGIKLHTFHVGMVCTVFALDFRFVYTRNVHFIGYLVGKIGSNGGLEFSELYFLLMRSIPMFQL